MYAGTDIGVFVSNRRRRYFESMSSSGLPRMAVVRLMAFRTPIVFCASLRTAAACGKITPLTSECSARFSVNTGSRSLNAIKRKHSHCEQQRPLVSGIIAMAAAIASRMSTRSG